MTLFLAAFMNEKEDGYLSDFSSSKESAYM